jgi:hypothetical protein
MRRAPEPNPPDDGVGGALGLHGFEQLAGEDDARCDASRLDRRPSRSAISAKEPMRPSLKCRDQTPRTPAGEIGKPSFLISLATRIWPNAGCSSENATIRASISGAARFARIGFLRLISCNASSVSALATRTYAMEELVAELGAAFLCADLRITDEPRADHAQYLTSWLAVLKADKKATFTAASKASEAAAFLAALQDA